MTTSTDKNKKHYSAEQITRAIRDKESWIDLINSITGSAIEGKRKGEPCPVCGTGTNRFMFDNKNGRGNNLCRKCDGGDGKSAKSRTGLRLIADILNCSFDEACNKAGEYLGMTPDQRHTTAAPRRKMKEPEPELSERERKFAEQMIKKALHNSVEIVDTAGQDYLRGRGLRVDYPVKNLRFNTIERYEKDQTPERWQQQALIAKLTDHRGKMESLQRIYIKDNGDKDTRKQTPKYTTHTNQQARASVKLFDPAEVMGIAEGVETALAAHELSNIPVWAAINAGRLECWQPPEIAKTIFIFADLDQSNTGYERAAKLYFKLKKQGLEVYLLMPGTVIPQGQKSVDFLDFYNSVRGMSFSIQQLKSLAFTVPEHSDTHNTTENRYQEWKEQAPIQIFPPGQVKTNQTSGKQTPKATLDNLSRLMEHYDVELKYNEINKQPEYTFPQSASFINDGEDLKANAAHGQIIDLMTINNMAITNLDAYLQTLQQKHTYNPVKDWMQSKAWNGHDYISDLLETVIVNTSTTDEPERRARLKDILIKKWLLGCCALAMDIISEFPFVLTFQSNKQGIGKTYWFRKLCPSDWRVDGVTLEVGNVDSEREALSHWLCELGEVDGTIRKSSMDSIKAFLSRTKDILRTPYAKYANTFKRRTAFFGTCNPTDFLRDDENRRFWVLPVTRVDSYHNIDMQQVWAQCLHLIQNGETHLLTATEAHALMESNQEFLPEHVIESAIRQRFDLSSDKKEFRKLTPQEILKECGFSASDRQRYTRICGRYLQKAFGERHRSNGKTWYWVPPIIPPNIGDAPNIDPFGDGGPEF